MRGTQNAMTQHFLSTFEFQKHAKLVHEKDSSFGGVIVVMVQQLGAQCVTRFLTSARFLRLGTTI